MSPSQGELWWAHAGTKRRPVLVVSRTAAADVLNRIVVAPVTGTIRGIPTEIMLDESYGLAKPSVASFDNLTAISKESLGDRIGALPLPEYEICRALGALANCSPTSRV